MKKTYHDYRGYVFSISYQPKDPAYYVDFADFPTIITSSHSLTQAFANACEALDLHLESLGKLGYPIPRPKHHLMVKNSGGRRKMHSVRG